jgi:hypothetical protein
MKSIIKMAIQLFLVFTIFQFLNSFILSVNNFININVLIVNINGIRTNNLPNIETNEFLKLFIPFIIIWCVYFIVVVIIWVKSEYISKAIIGKNELENVQLTLAGEDILSAGLSILSIYFIIDSSPRIFSYISNYVVGKTRFVDKDFLKEYTIRQTLEVIGISIKIILSLMLIKHKEKIIKIISVKK